MQPGRLLRPRDGASAPFSTSRPVNPSTLRAGRVIRVSGQAIELAPYSCIVGGMNESGPTASGRRLSSASWAGVADELSDIDAAGGLGASDLELLGTAAYLCGREDVSEEAWTRAHQLAIGEEEWSRAARV